MSVSSTTPFVSTIILTSNTIITYLSGIVLIGGICGELLNIIVFLSLRTFRQSSCAFYLLLSSVIKLLHLLIGLLSRFVISAANVDWTLISPFYCKFRAYFLQFCPFCALSLACLAVIDQYLATSTRPRWQQWSHIKIAYRLSGILLIICLLIAILHPIFFELVISFPSNKRACVITNKIFERYNNNFNLSTLFGPLPLLITIIFAVLTYHNVKQIAYRTVPLIRRRLDQQLTIMVLVQALFNVIVISPYITLFIIAINTTLLSDSTTSTQTQLTLSITVCIYYLYAASSFYIYICVSERFRHQLRYVLIDIHLNRWRHPQINPIHQTIPSIGQSGRIASSPS